MLASVGQGVPEPDKHDEAQLCAVEAGARASFELAEIHRWNPLVHMSNLDLACYDREYAPAAERAAARPADLGGWPDAIDGAISLSTRYRPRCSWPPAGREGPGGEPGVPRGRTRDTRAPARRSTGFLRISSMQVWPARPTPALVRTSWLRCWANQRR